ncbi:MAG TPA: formate/nitrite transporter family protein [Mycobacteriales bacterium]|nr:formate/nitrite transporter family protein [Mycobacteriales bacterium]
MAVAPAPDEIYARAEEEGRRRLGMPPLEQLSTAFIAGVTVVFAIAALGVTEGLTEPDVGAGLARVLGALAFGTGFVFLVVGRSELFTENFFGPVAATVDSGLRTGLRQLLRLWSFTLALNLVGGALLVAVLTVEGALPAGAPEALDGVADEIAAKSAAATLARAVLAGALLTLLSYLLHAVDSVLGRIAVTYMAGFLVALGPFDHVVVSALHLLFGLWHEAAVGWGDLAADLGLATAGNLVGGVLLMTLTHTAQVRGARGSTDVTAG